MLWLHLQPEEAPSLPDFSEQRRRALELPRLVAISATKALFPPYLHRLLNANLGLCWKLVISDCVYNSSCSEYTRILLAKVGLQFLF